MADGFVGPILAVLRVKPLRQLCGWSVLHINGASCRLSQLLIAAMPLRKGHQDCYRHTGIGEQRRSGKDSAGAAAGLSRQGPGDPLEDAPWDKGSMSTSQSIGRSAGRWAGSSRGGRVAVRAGSQQGGTAGR